MVSLLFSLLTLSSDGGGEVVLELAYEPKHCVTTPCPQFRILSAIKGEMPRQVAADLVNLDPAKSALSAFRQVRVTGTYVELEGVTQIKVSRWEVMVRENLEEQGK
jgi:hypothetical protein